MLLSEELKCLIKNDFMLVDETLIDKIAKIEEQTNCFSFNECVNEKKIIFDDCARPRCPLEYKKE